MSVSNLLSACSAIYGTFKRCTASCQHFHEPRAKALGEELQVLEPTIHSELGQARPSSVEVG